MKFVNGITAVIPLKICQGLLRVEQIQELSYRKQIVRQLHNNKSRAFIIYSSLFTITVVQYNIKNTLTNKLN